MVQIHLSDIDFSDRDLALLLKDYSSRAAKVVAEMDGYDSTTANRWREAFFGKAPRRRPIVGDMLGAHWSDVLVMLEAGDINGLRDWLQPEIETRQPRPKFKASKAGAQP